MRKPPGPMRMRRVSMSACATSRSGAGCGSHGAVWCSPIQASLKPSSSAQRSVWRSHWWPSYSGRSGGCEGIVNRPYSMAPPRSEVALLGEMHGVPASPPASDSTTRTRLPWGRSARGARGLPRRGTVGRRSDSPRTERGDTRRRTLSPRTRDFKLRSSTRSPAMATKTTAPSETRQNPAPLSASELKAIDAYWRASNYLSVGQIYLYGNPLLKKPLTKEHIKPRLLGHWGTTPGLNFIYVHLNRMIRKYDLDMIYIAGPGHGGPALVAQSYLEGTYSEYYPSISQDEEGMKRLFTQFSFPGGIPSHVAPETPGSIHEGGELGYALSHAYGAAFDNPDLVVAAVVGDGEADTGPLATSWHSNKFLNAATDGAVLPILHLNGYKIANPCILARISHEELEQLFRGYGYTPYFVEGDDPAAMHQRMAATLDTVVDEIRAIQATAPPGGRPGAAGRAMMRF